MVTVTAKFIVDLNNIEEFITLSKELIKNTRIEKGCIKYELYQDNKEINVFSIIEEWSDNDVLEMHLNSSHFLEIIPRLQTLTIQPIEINVYSKIF